MDPGEFFAELKRRRVYQVLVAYCIAAWLFLQLIGFSFQAFNVPAWALQAIIIFVVLAGLVVALLAWTFDRTDGGITRTLPASASEPSTRKTSRKWIVVVTLIGLSAAALTTWQFLRNRHADVQKETIAIVPFQNLSRDQNDAYLAAGISEAVAARLEKISALTVVSSTSSRFFSTSSGIQPDTEKQLSVSAVIYGSVQKAGDELTTVIHVSRLKSGPPSKYSRTTKIDSCLGLDGFIAKAITDDLGTVLSENERREFDNPLTNSIAAFTSYVSGMSMCQECQYSLRRSIPSITSTLEMHLKQPLRRTNFSP